LSRPRNLAPAAAARGGSSCCPSRTLGFTMSSEHRVKIRNSNILNALRRCRAPAHRAAVRGLRVGPRLDSRFRRALPLRPDPDNYCPSMRAEGSLPALQRPRERLAVVDTFLTLVDRLIAAAVFKGHAEGRPFSLTKLSHYLSLTRLLREGVLHAARPEPWGRQAPATTACTAPSKGPTSGVARSGKDGRRSR
jgi:hypothetical protein